MNTPPVTLQINLAPPDFPLVCHLLPHQLSAWRDQVGEILLTVDTRSSRGRFGTNWESNEEKLRALLDGLSGVRVLPVDYSVAAKQVIGNAFFGGRLPAEKDWRGGPAYAYFFGLHLCTHDFVLHLDSDIFIGGRSKHWLQEASALYQSDPSILFLSPWPGAPRPDRSLRQLKALPQSIDGTPGLLMEEMSTRAFFLQKSRLCSAIGPLPRTRPAWRARLIAALDGNPAAELPENVLSAAMHRHRLKCIGFLGTEPGLWTLHPPYRSADFFAKLPSLIQAVETNDLPELQRGDHDFNASMVDWTEALERMKRQRWWHRLRRRVSFSS